MKVSHVKGSTSVPYHLLVLTPNRTAFPNNLQALYANSHNATKNFIICNLLHNLCFWNPRYSTGEQ